MSAEIPGLAGLLDVHDVAATAASIARMQEPDGAIPWTTGGHTDVWNHLESAMALVVGGQREAAGRAFAWVRETQRADGSWPMKIVAGEVEDHSGESNMSAYVAVATWHHWLVARDEDFVRLMWPTVRRALDWVVSLQLPFGGVAWSQDRGIRSVEIRVDGGPWREATLADQDNIDTWRQWMYEWEPTSGTHTLEVRATDDTGYTQTDKRVPIAPNGSTGWHSVNVTGA